MDEGQITAIASLAAALGVGALLKQTLTWIREGISGRATRKRSEVDRIAGELARAIQDANEKLATKDQEHSVEKERWAEDLRQERMDGAREELRADEEASHRRQIQEHASQLRGILLENNIAVPPWPVRKDARGPYDKTGD